jgi:dihydropteroate synthase
MSTYYRPLIEASGSHVLAGGWCRFERVEVLERGQSSKLCLAAEIPKAYLKRLIRPRPNIGSVKIGRPLVMGILNVTPDSFSDGGRFEGSERSTERAAEMVHDGADVIDIGGESTRPGADFVPQEQEKSRTSPVIMALRQAGISIPLSIDTRKSSVAAAALKAGADWLNDVSALTYDIGMADVAARSGAPICLMHALSEHRTIPQKPNYDDVVLDVYDYLKSQIDSAVAQGVRRAQIIIDPGIGFGKTQHHNLQILRNLSIFHGLGCPLLLGSSRKRFIGTISGVEKAEERMPGSVSVALASIAQGAQIIRVHDVLETVQAFKLWAAVHG